MTGKMRRVCLSAATVHIQWHVCNVCNLLAHDRLCRQSVEANATRDPRDAVILAKLRYLTFIMCQDYTCRSHHTSARVLRHTADVRIKILGTGSTKERMKDLNFPRLSLWRSMSSWLWRHVFYQKFIEISVKIAASFFRVEKQICH